jgi:hypothetical protein
MKEYVEKLNKRLKEELSLADEEKRKVSPLQFDRAVGYANGIAIAIDIVNQIAEPRFLLDEDSICYGCTYYKHINNTAFDHTEDDCDEYGGCCDVPCVCVCGNMNTYGEHD